MKKYNELVKKLEKQFDVELWSNLDLDAADDIEILKKHLKYFIKHQNKIEKQLLELGDLYKEIEKQYTTFKEQLQEKYDIDFNTSFFDDVLEEYDDTAYHYLVQDFEDCKRFIHKLKPAIIKRLDTEVEDVYIEKALKEILVEVYEENIDLPKVPRVYSAVYEKQCEELIKYIRRYPPNLKEYDLSEVVDPVIKIIQEFAKQYGISDKYLLDLYYGNN